MSDEGDGFVFSASSTLSDRHRSPPSDTRFTILKSFTESALSTTRLARALVIELSPRQTLGLFRALTPTLPSKTPVRRSASALQREEINQA